MQINQVTPGRYCTTIVKLVTVPGRVQVAGVQGRLVVELAPKVRCSVRAIIRWAASAV
jgi:hypothetical protein